MSVAVTTSVTQPLATQIEAGQNHTGAAAAFADNDAISATGAHTFPATGLTASTTYYSHTVHRDAAGNVSNIVTSSSFTTDAAGATGSHGPFKGPFSGPFGGFVQ
jgi:hypothetical protein